MNWQSWNSPAGRITHLAASPDRTTLYAVALAGVHRQEDGSQWLDSGQPRRAAALYQSTDSGQNWAPAGNDLPPGVITALFAGPRTGDLLIGLTDAAEQSGLWRFMAADGGWRKVELNQDGLRIRSIVHNAGRRLLLVGAVTEEETPRSYILRSADEGASWTAVALEDVLLNALIPHSTDPQRFFMTAQDGSLYISADGGASWERQAGANAFSAKQIALRPDRAGHVFLVAEGPTLQHSIDHGATWRRVASTGLPLAARTGAFLMLPDGVLLLNTDAGTYRSVNAGATWQLLEGALSAGAVSQFLVLGDNAPQTTVLAATGYGLFVSRDSGALWQSLAAGLPANSRIRALLTHPALPGQVFAISDNRLAWEGGAPPAILLSNDGGKRWTPAANGLPPTQLTAWAQDPLDPAIMYMASTDDVQRSTDAGVSWQAARVPAGSHGALVISQDATHLYLAGNPLLQSTDRGATWQVLTAQIAAGGGNLPALSDLAIVPDDARHLWAATSVGAFESRDGGSTWQRSGLDGESVRWIKTVNDGQPTAGFTVFAGLASGGMLRRTAATQDWQPTDAGLPAGSRILAFVADPRTPDLLWTTRDGGGVYRSLDGGITWENVGNGVGDNLGQALAVDFSTPDSVLLGTANAGIWSSSATSATALASPTPAATAAPADWEPGVNARIEVLWPHGFASVQEARLANIGLRLFAPRSLQLPACGWRPRVTVWQAVGTNPAAPLQEAEQRTLDGQPVPFWDVNDIDVSPANDPNQKLYFFVRVEGVETATSIWAHAADARTVFPVQDTPSGIARGALDEVDARIQIVWPHDAAGNETPVTEAPLANVAVAFFKKGTRLSVPADWRPASLTLSGAWNSEVSRPLSRTPIMQLRRAGAITYPVWEFNNIAVGRAMEGSNRLYLWVSAEGLRTYPTIWAHGSDSRTLFPQQDEPIAGCAP